jgi:hypothetical protein
MPNKARESLLTMVGCPLKSEEQEPTIDIVQVDRVWHIEVNRGTKRLRLDIFDNGKLPEFEVKTLEV